MKGSHAMAHLYIMDPPVAVWWKGILSTHPPVGERMELLAGMGDGIIPDDLDGKEPEGSELPRDAPSSPGEPTLESVVTYGGQGIGFLDAALYGIAVGTVAIAVLTVANSAFLLLGSGNFRAGLITPFHLPAALAAGFSARKRGIAGILALGFALLVFLFHWVFLAPLLPFMPDSEMFPLRWIVWTLVSDIAVVVMAAIVGASFDRWSRWAKALAGKMKNGTGRSSSERNL
jgi:hypothetical protein